MTFLGATTLTGRLVRLEPLAEGHVDGLADAVRDGRIHDLWYTSAPQPEAMASDVANKLSLARQGQMLPFAIRRFADDRLIGVTTFCSPLPAVPAVEIGYAWQSASARLWTGEVTDTAQYSITDDDWPAVRRHLDHLLVS